MSSDDDSSIEMIHSEEDNEFSFGIRNRKSRNTESKRRPTFLAASSVTLQPSGDNMEVESSDDESSQFNQKNEFDTEFDSLLSGVGATRNTRSDDDHFTDDTPAMGSGLGYEPDPNDATISEGGMGASSSSSFSSSSSSRPAFLSAFTKAAAPKTESSTETGARKGNASVDPSLSQWERHTTGFGSKMLAKFGFSGRLGAKEDGITQSIQLEYTPIAGQAHGVGFGGMKKKDKDKDSVRGETRMRGSEVSQQSRGPLKPKPVKKKKVKATVKFIGMDDDNDGHADGRNENVTVRESVRIDMRAPEGKADDGTQSRGGFGLELLYNLTAMLQSVTAELQQSQKLEDRDSRRRAALAADIGEAKRLAESLDAVATRQRRLHVTLAKLHRMQKKQRVLGPSHLSHRVAAKPSDQVDPGMEDDEVSMSITSLAVLFADLYADFPGEFASLGLWDVLSQLAQPCIQHELREWCDDPFSDPSGVVRHFQQWSVLLKCIDEARDSEAAACIYSMYDHAIMSDVRRRLLNDWDAVAEAGEGLQLMRCVKLILSSDAFVALCSAVIVPKLTRALLAWQSRVPPTQPHAHRASDAVVVPLDQWLLPWRNVVGASAFDSLLPDVKTKLNSAIAKLLHQGLLESAASVLLPWVGVLDKKATDDIAARTIAPALAKALQSVRSFAPPSPSLDTLRKVVAFSSVLPGALLDALLLGEFFPKLMASLCETLEISVTGEGGKPTCNASGEHGHSSLRAAAAVYMQFRNTLPLQVMRRRRIYQAMGRCLTVLSRAKEGLTLEGLCWSQEMATYTGALADIRRADAITQEADRQRASRGARMTFKDVIMDIAGRRDLPFYPILGRRENNKQVCQLGMHKVYLDGDVVFLYEGDRFRPVSLQDLFSLEQ